MEKRTIPLTEDRPISISETRLLRIENKLEAIDRREKRILQLVAQTKAFFNLLKRVDTYLRATKRVIKNKKLGKLRIYLQKRIASILKQTGGLR